MILIGIKLASNGSTEKEKMRTALRQVVEEFFNVDYYKDIYD